MCIRDRCGTGPTPTSGSTSPTASPHSRSPTSCADKRPKPGLQLSVRELLDHLAGIQETLLLYPSTGGRPRALRMLTQMNPTQQQLFELFGLDHYAPTR